MRYRDYEIRHEPNVAGLDWAFSHVDYDGPEDSRYGYAATLEDAKAHIDERGDEE